MKLRRSFLAWSLAFAASSAGAQVTLTTSSWVPPTHALTVTQAEWCAHVTEATAGRVRCNALAKPVTAPPGTFDAVRDGLTDVSFSVHGYTPGRYVFTAMSELPFMGDSAEATSVAYQRIHEKYFAALGEHKGMRVLTVFTHGPGMIINTKRAVNAMADMDGLKFRVGGGVVNEIGKIAGINVTLRPAPQSYELLSSGVMDVVFFPAESVESFKLEKLVKHRTTFPGGLYNTSFAFVMNEAAWKKSPQPIRRPSASSRVSTWPECLAVPGTRPTDWAPRLCRQTVCSIRWRARPSPSRCVPRPVNSSVSGWPTPRPRDWPIPSRSFANIAPRLPSCNDA